MSTPRKWTMEAVRKWVLDRLYEAYEASPRRSLDYDPRLKDKYVAGGWLPYDDVYAQCKLLERQGMIELSESADGFFSAQLKPETYAMIRESLEKQKQADERRRIGF
jgi:hypothetical protein